MAAFPKIIPSYRHGALGKRAGKERFERLLGSFCAPYCAKTQWRRSWASSLPREERMDIASGPNIADGRGLAAHKKDPGKIQGRRTVPRLVLSSGALPGSR